jgi:hypothetical protein
MRQATGTPNGKGTLRLAFHFIYEEGSEVPKNALKIKSCVGKSIRGMQLRGARRGTLNVRGETNSCSDMACPNAEISFTGVTNQRDERFLMAPACITNMPAT